MQIIKTRKGEEIKVDDRWYEELSKHSWYINYGYAVAGKRCKVENRQRCYKMHQYIYWLEHGFISNLKHQVDHINRDKLNNQISNLRISTHSENCLNKDCVKTPYISWHKGNGKYMIRKRINGKLKHFGCYETLAIAEKRRDELVENNWRS